MPSSRFTDFSPRPSMRSTPIAITLLPLLAMAALAQQPTARPAARRPAVTQPARQPSVRRDTAPANVSLTLDTTVLATARWREIGPYRGGRSVAVAGSAARPHEYWMGTTGGGVFKTTDGGLTWLPVTDKAFGGTIGAIAVAESNPDIVYVGGGEYPIRGNVSHGDGVWKTTDGGRTWTSLGLTATRQIARMRVHPRDPNIVWVAAQGHVFGPGPDRGIYKTVDGGKSWRKTGFVNDSTGAADLTLDPANPNVMYAGFWQAWRTPWTLVSGGAGSGMYKSVDGGETWTSLKNNAGLPRGIWGNIGISVSAARPARVYAIIEADSGGVFRSEDAGATWTRVNDERKLRQRAWYYTKIYADPRDANVVYASNVNFQKSTDGGRTWRNIRTPHGDSHDLWIAPNDSRRMVEGNDGGANVSFNGGQSWTEQDYATAQFYHVITTTHFPYYVCGAQQDNSTICGPSRWPGGIPMEEWYEVAGGESGYIASRSDNPDITYGGSYGGYLTRHDRKTGFERNVNPWPDNPMGHSAGDLAQRFQWTFPIVLSPHNPNVLYAASQMLFRTENEGESWRAISGDLTRHDPKTLGPSGGPITRDQTSVEYYGTIFAVAESPVLAGIIWTGSDDGLVHVTTDAGKSWRNVTPSGLPEWARISIIEPSHFHAGTAYLAANRFQMGDHQPYLYRTTDFGRTWTRIDSSIARTEFTRVIREDPLRRGLLFAGTERGVWVSLNDGRTWQSLQRNLPPVPIHDIAVPAEGDVVAGTHGRSFWILDDLSVLRQMADSIPATEAHLFQPRDPWRVSWGQPGPQWGGAHPVGRNPPSGASVSYWLKQGNREVTLEFLDARGAVLRSFTSTPDSLTMLDSLRGDSLRRAQRDSLQRTGISADSITKLQARSEETPDAAPEPGRLPRAQRVPNKAGMNTFAWNLRIEDAQPFEGMILWAGSMNGPVVLPGAYRVRMKVDGREVATRPFTLRQDPRSKATTAELREQFAFLTRIRDKVTAANQAVIEIRKLKSAIASRRAMLAGTQLIAFEVPARTLEQGLSEVEDSIYQTRNRSSQDPLNYPIRLNNKLAALTGVVASTEARPTQQSYEVFTRLSMRLDLQLLKLDELVKQWVPAVNRALRAAGQEPVDAPARSFR